MSVEPTEDVYVAAATASVRAEGVNDGYIASTSRDEPFRAAVRVAYAAALPAGRALDARHLPLLDLTAQEIEALILAARAYTHVSKGPTPYVLRSALDKLTTAEAQP